MAAHTVHAHTAAGLCLGALRDVHVTDAKLQQTHPPSITYPRYGTCPLRLLRDYVGCRMNFTVCTESAEIVPEERRTVLFHPCACPSFLPTHHYIDPEKISFTLTIRLSVARRTSQHPFSQTIRQSENPTVRQVGRRAGNEVQFRIGM